MADALQSALTWLAQQQRGTSTTAPQVGQAVTYTRGATVAGGDGKLFATIGETAFRYSDLVKGQVKLEHSDADFCFTCADLVSYGITMPPVQGDTISYAGAVYGLFHPPGEKPYKMDGYGIAVRVHTKRTSL